MTLEKIGGGRKIRETQTNLKKKLLFKKGAFEKIGHTSKIILIMIIMRMITMMIMIVMTIIYNKLKSYKTS